MCYNIFMTSGGNTKPRSLAERLARWLDEWRLAGAGILLATRKKRFLVVFVLSFIIFGTLMTLLAGSTAAFTLFGMADFGGKMKIIGDGFLGLFGVGRNFWDFLLTFVITLIQSILIGLVALVWQTKRRRRKAERVVAQASNADNVETAGLAAGLAVLGTGCPTCGTALITPVLGTFFSTSSYALAGTISGILTLAVAIIALLALKRIGGDAYVLLISERYHKKRAAASPQEEKPNEISA